MKADGGDPVLTSVYERTKSQVHPRVFKHNTSKEAQILRTKDINHCSGPTLILTGTHGKLQLSKFLKS